MSVPVKIYRTVTYQEGQTPSNPNLSGDPVVNPINPNGGAAEELVPYDGAIKDVNLGEKGLSTGFVQYDTTPTDTPTGSGTVVWNPDKYTLDLSMGLGDSVQQIGMEVYYTPVKNQTGSLIPDGTFVMATGSLGNSGRITIAPAVTDGSVDSKYMLGVTTHDIADGEDGLVTWFGEIRGFNTNTKAPVGETWIDGTVLWNNPAVAGGFTSIEPQAPNLKIPVAIIISAGNNGVIFVRPRLGMRLTDLHDVDAFTPSDKDLISYDSALGHWNAKSLGSVIGGTSSQFLKGDGSLDSNSYALASQINIASGQVAFGTGSGTIGGDSGLTWDNVNKKLSLTGTTSSAGLIIDARRDNFPASELQSFIYSTSSGGTYPFNLVGHLVIQPRTSNNNHIIFATGNGTTDWQWRITEIGILQSNGPKVLANTSGDFRINSFNNILITSTSGNTLIGPLSSPTETLDVNGTARIRTLSNATGDFVTASATGVLQKRTAAEVLTDIGGIGGSGTTNYIPKFTGAGTIGDSQIFDNGTNVGIGTTSFSGQKLRVNGTGSFILGNSNTNDLTIEGYNNRGLSVGNANFGGVYGFQFNNITANGAAYGTALHMNARYDGTNYISQNSFIRPQLLLLRDGDFRFYRSNNTTINTNITLTEIVSITNEGTLGIGVSEPTNTLDVNGTARIRTLSGTVGYLPLMSATGVMGQSVVYNTSAGSVLIGTINEVSGHKVRISGGALNITNWQSSEGAYDKLSIDFGENRGFGYDPTPNEIFVKGATTVPVKIDTDAPTDSLNVLSTGGIKMSNIPSGTATTALGLDSNNEIVKFSNNQYKFIQTKAGVTKSTLPLGIDLTDSFNEERETMFDNAVLVGSRSFESSVECPANSVYLIKGNVRVTTGANTPTPTFSVRMNFFGYNENALRTDFPFQGSQITTGNYLLNFEIRISFTDSPSNSMFIDMKMYKFEETGTTVEARGFVSTPSNAFSITGTSTLDILLGGNNNTVGEILLIECKKLK